MSDDSLTARNRINQRNFRARRQNYIKELEERIRKYESEGVQATIEIQAAARQVTDQNIKLRNLLVQKFGMTEYELVNYLGYPQPSPTVNNQPFPPVSAGSGQQFATLAPAPSGSLAPHQSSSTDAANSYPTPPLQTEPSRSLTSSILDPALSLASLHKHPSVSYDQRPYPECMTTSRHSSDHSIHQTLDSNPSPYDSRRADSPTDTLSESSNPATPAEQMQTDHTRPYPKFQPSALTSCCKTTTETQSTPRMPRANDETSCEEAARIIASMRGGDGNTEEVMLELGCADRNARCKVNNISIFQLMDSQ